MRRFVLSVLLLESMSGCYMSRVTASGNAGTAYSDTGFSLFWGMTRTDHGATECQYGLKEVTHYWPWYTYFLQVITVGIVSPVKREYTCIASPPAATVGAPH